MTHNGIIIMYKDPYLIYMTLDIVFIMIEALFMIIYVVLD